MEGPDAKDRGEIAPGSQPARRHLDTVIVARETEIAAIEKPVQALIRATHRCARQSRRWARSLASASTASSLLALMPGLATLDRRRVAALGALAPHPNQSGDTERYRRTKGGRRDVRSVLFIPALSASQHHKTLSVFYQRLLARGKRPLVAFEGDQPANATSGRSETPWQGAKEGRF